MSADEFWKDDPQLFVSYRISFINKKQRELEEIDYKSWLMGLYVHDGNGKLFASLKQFIRNFVSKHKNNDKIESYPEKPYRELAKTKKEEKENQQKEINYENYEKSLQYYGTMKQRYLDKMKRKESEK